MRIRGGQFVIENQSFVFANNTGPADAGGGIAIEAEAVTIGTGSRVTTDALGADAGGPLALRAAGKVPVTNGSVVASNVFAGGDAGPVAVRVGALEVHTGARLTHQKP